MRQEKSEATYAEAVARLVRQDVSRREFLRALSGGALVFAAGGLLAGCGGGGGGGNSSGTGQAVSTRVMSATVNTQEIGGSGLVIQSGLQAASPLSASGAFTTKTSQQGAQLLSVADGAGKIRGLMIAVPAGTANSARPKATGSADPRATDSTQIDAASTAFALVFLTPGILSTSPGEAATRLAEIGSLSSFVALVTFLQQNLSGTALSDLAQNTILDGLKANCINDWVNSQLHASVISPTKPHTAATQAHFDATYGPGFGSGNTSPVILTNGAWRFVSVVRQEFDPASVLLIPPDTSKATLSHGDSTLGGATALTWGSVFTATAGAPGKDTGQADLSNPHVASLKYWAYGPGRQSLSDPDAPSTQYFETNRVGFYTFWYYVMSPFLDIVVGGLGIFAKGVTLLKATADGTGVVWGVAGNTLNSAGLLSALSEGNRGDAVAAGVDLGLGCLGLLDTILGVLVEAEALGAVGLVASEVIGAIALFAGVLAAAFSAANLSIAVAQWLLLPQVASVELPLSKGTITVG